VEADSAHFRYFATSTDRIPAGILDRLEQHRTDVLGYLGLPDEDVVSYYRFDRVEDFYMVDGCMNSEGCTQGNRVYTTVAFDEHELVHAYLSAWRQGSLVTEGIAETFHCGEPLRDFVFARPLTLDWKALIGQSAMYHEGEPYRWGLRLVLYLIRAYGQNRFLAYYKTTHYTDDPALFALEFERFWGESIDQVWSVLVADMDSTPVPICPCGLPVVSTDGSSMLISEFADYRVLPIVPIGETLVVSLDSSGPQLGLCAAASTIPLIAPSTNASALSGSTLAAIRPDDSRYFLSVTNAGAITGQLASLIQPDCGGAGTLNFSADNGHVAIVVPRRGDSLPWYLTLSTLSQSVLDRQDDGAVQAGTYPDCSLGTYSALLSGSTRPGGDMLLEMAAPLYAPGANPLAVVGFAVTP
jgi:hypothetical protein